jgi:HEAT repeat protein
MRRAGLVTVLLAISLGRAEEEAPSRECTCQQGCGSYLYLRCPKPAPFDPDPCPATHHGIHPEKPLPGPWNNLCSAQPRMGCFLRRHAASWGISCSLCAVEKCCPFPNCANCPECHGEKGEVPAGHQQMAQIAKEQQTLFKEPLEIAKSANYLAITDLKWLKIAVANGNRVADQHELLHLYLQRAEMARRDFVNAFGDRVHKGTSCIVFVRSDSLSKKMGMHYVGSTPNVVKGYGSTNKWPAGAGNGIFVSGKDDDDLHFRIRHMIGHLCMSTYMQVEPNEKYLPHWIDEGCAHWLSKLHPRARDFATFCQFEGVTLSGGGGRGGGRGAGGGAGNPAGGGGGGPAVGGSGAKWDMKAAKIARIGPKKDPVEAMFQAATAKQLDFEKHVRAWSWFDTFTREEKEPFAKFIQGLRKAEEPRAAAKEAWGQAPELVDDRWREFVLGKRGSAAATEKEKETETELGEATSRELQDIGAEEDLQLLASRIRGLEMCKTVATARLLVSLIDSRDSERVRAVISLMFERTEDAEVLAWMRGDGYKRAGKLARAALLRAFGARGDKEAIPLCREGLSDSFWLVRANAARSLGQLGDLDSRKALSDMAATGANSKLRMAAMDALGLLGAEAADTIPLWESNLMNPAWQVKVATCDAFRAIGSTKAMDMLIGRLDSEGGRVQDEIHDALKKLSGNDRDMTREEWNTWWTHTKKFGDIERKSKEELEKEGSLPAAPTAGGTSARAVVKQPTYYGIKVYARTVGYVLDVSESMTTGFEVSADWEAKLGHEFKGKTKIAVAKEEIAHAIRSMDPRTRLNLYFFNTEARAWQTAPVAAGTMGENAVSAVQNTDCKLQTNYYDALRLVLGLEDGKDPWAVAFCDTPDTLFFLTDGTPTEGEITKTDEIRTWFREQNRFARLKLHVITMGTMGVELDFLPAFAKENGGQFVQLTGTH